MKNYLSKLLCIALISMFTVSCEKEEIEVITEKETEIEQGIESLKAKQPQKSDDGPVDVTHTYHYQGSTFNVTYTLDGEEGDITSVSGDIAMAESVFSKDEGGKALYFDNPVEGSKNISIRVFDTDDEMKLYAESTLGLPQEDNAARQDSRSCTSYNNWGHGRYYFYKHAYYNTEMISLRRTNTRRMGNHWVGSGNNDQMSSVIMGMPSGYRSYLSLKEHICYGGRSLNFYIINYYSSYTYFGVRNLSWYTLSWRWFRRTSWNDQVSSYKGWTWY